ncbi:hypothetical protein Tco_0374874 [Tanacetum coccineum]
MRMIDMQPFKNNMERNDTLVRICDIKQLKVDVSEADLDVIDLDLFGSDLEDVIDTKRTNMLRDLRK